VEFPKKCKQTVCQEEKEMSEHDKVVDRQRRLLSAEKWARGVKTLHAHSLTSLWYDDRGNDGSVMDTEYNDGLVMREIRKTGEIVYFGKSLEGDELLQHFGQHTGK
tara:strand:- start:84 stop:401 length:318 start_codon:yes stop_codon:yes gene_type:complete